jgi:hypothetical protein
MMSSGHGRIRWQTGKDDQTLELHDETTNYPLLSTKRTTLRRSVALHKLNARPLQCLQLSKEASRQCHPRAFAVSDVSVIQVRLSGLLTKQARFPLKKSQITRAQDPYFNMSALGLFRSRTTTRALAPSASIASTPRVPHSRYLSIYRDNTKLAVDYRRDISTVMENPTLDDLKKYRISKIFYTLSDYHYAQAELKALREKWWEDCRRIAHLKSPEYGRVFRKTRRGAMDAELAKEEEVAKLRFRACKLCVFAAWDEISLYERAIRSFDLVFMGWYLSPLNLFVFRRFIAAVKWLDRRGG